MTFYCPLRSFQGSWRKIIIFYSYSWSQSRSSIRVRDFKSPESTKNGSVLQHSYRLHYKVLSWQCKHSCMLNTDNKTEYIWKVYSLPLDKQVFISTERDSTFCGKTFPEGQSVLYIYAALVRDPISGAPAPVGINKIKMPSSIIINFGLDPAPRFC